MILSVVIVSYNVKYFLEQCLSSLTKAIAGISYVSASTEVYIVDNASSDGTVDFLEHVFPDFHFIRNKQNEGFAKANNLALLLCDGEFVLFLNPDIILPEDSLDLCLRFFMGHENAGSVGVRMIDGAGRFLRESKRGFPGPAASFFKLTGLARLFPRSKIFSSYYLGHLHEDHTQVVDVLSGAFMMIRKSVLVEIGGFDERFFMYAEDIDLSFRIMSTGKRNYYLPDTTIIHFKGESTLKNTGYIKTFYSAMQLFMKKHFGKSEPSSRLIILTLGIRLREVFAFILLQLRKTDSVSRPHKHFFIKGNAENKEILKQKLANHELLVSEKEKKADAIIYCEDNSFSWKTIIAEVRQKPASHLNYFHGTGTHAVVGSQSGEKRGQVIEL